jgi:hypothetical protein
MRRSLWIIGILFGIGLIAAVVCRRMCTCCKPEEEGETEDSREEKELSGEEGKAQEEESEVEG